MNNYSEIVSEIEKSQDALRKMRPAGEASAWSTTSARNAAAKLEYEAMASGAPERQVAPQVQRYEDARIEYVKLMRQADSSIAIAEKYLAALAAAAKDLNTSARVGQPRRARFM